MIEVLAMPQSDTPSTVPEANYSPPRLIELKEACRIGRFGKTTAYKLLSEGKIKARKAGRKTMVDRDTLDRYLASLPEMQSHATPRKRR